MMKGGNCGGKGGNWQQPGNCDGKGGNWQQPGNCGGKGGVKGRGDYYDELPRPLVAKFVYDNGRVRVYLPPDLKKTLGLLWIKDKNACLSYADKIAEIHASAHKDKNITLEDQCRQLVGIYREILKLLLDIANAEPSSAAWVPEEPEEHQEHEEHDDDDEEHQEPEEHQEDEDEEHREDEDEDEEHEKPEEPEEPVDAWDD